MFIIFSWLLLFCFTCFVFSYLFSLICCFFFVSLYFMIIFELFRPNNRKVIFHSLSLSLPSFWIIYEYQLESLVFGFAGIFVLYMWNVKCGMWNANTTSSTSDKNKIHCALASANQKQNRNACNCVMKVKLFRFIEDNFSFIFKH